MEDLLPSIGPGVIAMQDTAHEIEVLWSDIRAAALRLFDDLRHLYPMHGEASFAELQLLVQQIDAATKPATVDELTKQMAVLGKATLVSHRIRRYLDEGDVGEGFEKMKTVLRSRLERRADEYTDPASENNLNHCRRIVADFCKRRPPNNAAELMDLARHLTSAGEMLDSFERNMNRRFY